MRKRLVLLFVLISSILCMVGCGSKNPYDKLSIESTNNGQEVQLNIVEEVVDGSTVYKYDSYSFDVKVKDAGKDISTGVSVQGGQGMVEYTAVYKGNGVTTINVKPISPDKTGKFSMLIKTLEGNKSMTVDFKIDLKINSFVFNYDSLKVISKGKEFNLNNIDEFIDFSPVNTTQKDIVFELVKPSNGLIDGHMGATYVDKEISDTYAVIENNVLKTFSGVEYPKKIANASTGDGVDSYDYYQCITLKASYVGSDAYNLDKDGNRTTKRIPDKFIDIEVIEDCSNVNLLMNYQINNNKINDGDSSFVLEKNDKGEYDVTLLNPNYSYGMIYDTYYIERDLKFDFGKSDESYNPNDYHVITNAVLETDNKPIVLSYSSLDNSFKVQAQSSGTYSHVFTLDHVKYPNAVNREVVVNFHVLDLPTDIKINGEVVKDSYKVYDFYASSYGARFNVDLNNSVSKFNYFVFSKNEDIYKNMQIYKSDGIEQLMAICKKENNVTTINTEQFSYFKDNETFFIRHSYDKIPNDDVIIYVGVQYSVASSSYSQEVKDNYFVSNFVEFPIVLDLEYGIKDLQFTQSKYKIDVTNPDYRDNVENYAGIKLFDLPKGHTFESAIGENGITYDHKLINVYDIYDPYNEVYSVYMKINKDYIVGETKIIVTSRNGIVRSADVETFIPSVYAQEADNKEQLFDMPLGMKFNINTPLFYFANSNENGPQENYILYDLSDIENPVYFGEYLSANTLIMLTNSSMELKFYDYLLAYDEENNRSIVPLDITNKLTVEFSTKGYAEYSNGKLKIKDKITSNFDNPILMRIHGWSNGYMGVNEKGEKVYKTYYLDHTIKLYIYKPLDNVNVTTLTNFQLYVEDYLGYQDIEDQRSIGKVETNFQSANTSLGSQWNEKWEEIVGFDWWQEQVGTIVDPVDLIYDFELMRDMLIYDSNGEAIKIRSLRSGKDPYTLTFGDLFTKDEEKSTRYTLVLKSKISDNLLNWIANTSESGYLSSDADSVLAKYVFNKNIMLDINVYAKQFSKLQVIATIKFTAKVATRSGAINLDIPDDGVYFKVEHDSSDELSQKIGYSVDNANAINKTIILINADNSLFTATLDPSASGKNGTIKIVAKKGAAGDNYLTVVPQDNIKNVDENGNYIFFDNSLVQKFRVHVSDGSELYPYEIKSVNDYNDMQRNIANGKYYHYVLTTNINLNDVESIGLNVTPGDNVRFSLSGTYAYYRNDVEYKVISRLYNLNIKETINVPVGSTDDVYIGLFSKLTKNVTLQDITLINASIDLTIKSLNGKNLYVGLLGADADQSKIWNSQVIGNIKITNATDEDIGANLHVGGMFGSANKITLQGSPITYQMGLSNSAYNANVGINYSLINSTDCEDIINNYTFNVGGLIGTDALSTLTNINVLPTIKGINYKSAVGGVIGYSKYSKIENVVVYPKIDIQDYKIANGAIIDQDNIINVGGFVGSGHPTSRSEELSITNSKVYFAKEYDDKCTIWSNKVAIYVDTSAKANVGGLIGSANGNDIFCSYNYARSFYSEDFSNNYKGNIYVKANADSNIGGLVGFANCYIKLRSSYFDGDIVAQNNHNIGLLVGSISNGSVENSYAIGGIALIDGSNISIVKGINNNAGMFGNMNGLVESIASNSGTIFGVQDLLSTATYKSKNYRFTIGDVYSVVNDNIYYFGESNSVHALYETDKTLIDIIPDIASYGNVGLYFKDQLEYRLWVDQTNTSSPDNPIWLWNKEVNIAGTIPFPMLFNSDGTKAMFDVVPKSISVKRINESYNGFYDISANDKVQVLMFVNKNSSNIKSEYYEIRIDDDSSAISIIFDGATVISSFIEINSELEMVEDSSGSIISLAGSKIYPKGEGIATLTIRSVLDKTVKLNILFKVIAGISDIEILYSNEKNDGYNKFDEIGEREENPNTGVLEDTYFTNVYVDEVSNYKISNNNVIDGVTYNSSRGYGYIVEVLKNKDDGSESDGKININGKDYKYQDGQNNKYLIQTSDLTIKGVEIGFIRLKFTPCILLDDVEVKAGEAPYKVLEDLTSDIYRFMIGSRARSVDVDKDNIKIASKNSTNINVVFETSNVIIEPSALEGIYNVNILSNFTIAIGTLKYVINCEGMYTATKDADGVYTLVKNDGTVWYEIEYQLIKFKIALPTIRLTEKDAISSKNTYSVVFGITVDFNADYYRENANDIDLNTVAYSFRFIPNSNQSLKDSIIVSISPAELTELFTNFYTKGELLFNSDQENYPAENESSFIVPGRSGLLKITMDEEFNDSSYLEILIDNKYKPYLKVQQMAGYVENIADSGELLDSITAYNELAYDEEFERSKEYGIKLSKLTLNYNDRNYFNKTYFVKIDLNRNYGLLEKIDLKIVSYKVTNDTVEIKPTKDFSLKVTQLPVVDVKLDNEYDSNLGKGVKKALEISYKAVTNDINFSMKQTDSYEGAPVVLDPDSDSDSEVVGRYSELYKVYVVDEEGNEVNGIFDIDYLNAGKKYYICADVKANLQKLVMNFSVSEIILGVREEAKSDLTINIVEFEIDHISVSKATGDRGIITLKHGQSYVLATNITYTTPTVQTLPHGVIEESLDSPINKYKLKLDESWTGIVSLIEFAMAGTDVTDASKNYIINGNNVTLRYKFNNGTTSEYRDVVNNKVYNHISISKDSDSKIPNGDFDYVPYVIQATSVTGQDAPEELQLIIPYYYENGKMIVGTGSIYYEKIIEFKIVVEDNSTYDHPNPIEDAAQLIDACNSNGGDYILLNNITLRNWAPIVANFDSLDGNGYSIIIESFGLSQLRGSESAVNVGVFSEVSEHTLLKNIIVDVGSLLKTEETMIRDVENLRNSNKSSYEYKDSLDLAFTTEVNFGILAGVNNGAITNARIVNLNEKAYVSNQLYLHLNTNQGYVNEKFITTKMGGLVGINSATGAITNSFVGLNVSGKSGDLYTIKTVTNPSPDKQNNTEDILEDKVEIYPFIIAGGNILGGLVAENQGIISNSYTKALGLYNTYPAVEDSKTAGFVATNNGTITSAYVEGLNIVNYRSVEDKFLIESTGNIGGFVFENNSVIENAYANVVLETQSAFTGGFVFRNNTNAEIRNSYAAATNKNNLAHGQFTGVGANGRDVLNSGKYTYCYYLVINNETENLDEHAIAVKSASTDIGKASAWKGFSIAEVEDTNRDLIWKISDVTGCPTILTSLMDTYSFRKLVSVEDKVVEKDPSEGDSGDGLEIGKVTIYTYSYDTACQLGSEVNPLIIDKPEHLHEYILDLSINPEYALGNSYGKYVFGLRSNENGLGNLNNISYVRLVNNLDFTNLTNAISRKITEDINIYLYGIIFAGVFDGNGMELKNLNINSANDAELDSFGLFSQIGFSYEDAKKLGNIQTVPAIIKNLNMSVRTYQSGASSRAGVLAGTILNSKIINVKINGGMNGDKIIISGQNMTGGLAGLIYTDDKGMNYLQDIVVENIALEATMASLGGPLTDKSEDMSYGFYKVFSIINSANGKEINSSFKMLGDQLYETGTKNIRTDVSYAGTVAGVIFGNNNNNIVTYWQNVEDYRTSTDATINNIVVKDNVNIRTADHAGGLFGYVGMNTVIKNSKFILNGNQLIKALNFAGGLVGENHGVLEQCTIAFDDETQAKIDKNILKNNRESGDYLLFSNKNVDSNGPSLSDYTVGIGGLVGYSKNGVILDCYAKVNVIKPSAYIAGGILGYSENLNYIGYTYTTGAVYGKMVTSGIVGVVVVEAVEELIEYQDYLTMTNVVSLTDWNYTTYDCRQNITAMLYENQKNLYKTNYNFYIKMPEVGNVLPKLSKTATNDTNMPANEKNYWAGHNNYYVGSAVGLALVNDKSIIEGTALNDIIIANDGTYHSMFWGGENQKEKNMILYNTTDLTGPEAKNNKLQYLCFNKSKNVISNTLGIYSESGSLANNNKQDSYDNKFTYKTSAGKTVDIYSYRIPYQEGGINSYQNIDENNQTGSESTTNTYYDSYNYFKIFTAQEYTQQILGRYSTMVSVAGTGSENIDDKTSKMTVNLFDNDFNASNRFKTASTNAFASSHSVWVINSLLPEYNTEGYESTKYIRNVNDLSDALKYGGRGITYKVKPQEATIDADGNSSWKDVVKADDYKITLDIDGKIDQLIQFTNTLRDSFVGEPYSDGTKPKIVININENIDGNPSSIVSVMNLLYGATFINIEFVINYNGYNANSHKTNNDYGLFANTLENSYIDNCVFTLDLKTNGNDATVDLSGSGNSNDTNYISKNNGLFFGAIYNSTIINSTFNVSISKIVINDPDIVNFGGFAGLISKSTIKGNTFGLNGKNGNPITVDLKDHGTSLNFGTVAGSILSSTFDNNNLSNNIIYTTILTINEYQCGNTKQISNVGFVFGSVDKSSIVKINGLLNEDAMKYVFADDSNYNGNIPNLNLAIVAGMSSDSMFDDFVNRMGLKSCIESTSIMKEMNIGSIVGYDNGNTKLGARANTLKQGSSSERYSYIGNEGNVSTDCGQSRHHVKVLELSLGGLVGYSKSSNNLLSNAYNNDYVTLVNFAKGDNKTTVQNYVGGLVGRASGGVGMHDVLSAGLIRVETSEVNLQTKYYIGGIVGYSDGYVEIEDFASMPDFKIDTDSNVKYGISYVAGVVGYMKSGNFVAQNGYSYVELPQETGDIGKYYDASSGRGDNKAGILTASIVNGYKASCISNKCKNVFYAQEFIGNNYEAEVYFRGFAMADLYPHIFKDGSATTDRIVNTRSEIYNNLYNVDDRSFDLKQATNNTVLIGIFIPNGLGSSFVYTHYESVDDEGSTRFNPKMMPAGSYDSDTKTMTVDANARFGDVSTKYYYVILDRIGSGPNYKKINKWNVYITNNYSVISGQTTDDGKILLNNTGVDGSTTKSSYIVNNHGVISNVYMKTDWSYKKDNKDYVLKSKYSLVGVNNGLITNCYVYGETSGTYSFAKTNNGRIYQSSSVTISDQKTIYGLVELNNGTGIISDCYSRNFVGGTHPNSSIYGVAKYNLGIVRYVMFEVPEIVAKYQTIKGAYYSTTYVGVAQSDVNKKACNKVQVATKSLPQEFAKRRGIWTTVKDETMTTLEWKRNIGYNNDDFKHVQILGIKDIDGAIVIIPKLDMYSYKDYPTGPGMDEGKTITLRKDSSVSVYGSEISNNTDSEFGYERISGVPIYNGFSNYRFVYSFSYYVSKENLPTYNMIKIDKGEDLVAYLEYLYEEGLKKGNAVATIPNNTMILIDGSISVNKFYPIDIPDDSVFAGYGYDPYPNSSDYYIYREIYYSPAYFSTITYAGKKDITHSLVKNNYGILMGLRFDNFNFSINGSNISTQSIWGPIQNNYGIVFSVHMDNMTIKTNYYKVGLIVMNMCGGVKTYTSGGGVTLARPILAYSTISNYNISSSKNFALSGDWNLYTYLYINSYDDNPYNKFWNLKASVIDSENHNNMIKNCELWVENSVDNRSDDYWWYWGDKTS